MKLNFKISHNTYTRLNRYATSLNLPVTVIIRFLLIEQIHAYTINRTQFDEDYKNCNPHDILGRTTSYQKEIPPKSYNLVVSDYIYHNIKKMKIAYKEAKTSKFINNLIHIGLSKKLRDANDEYRTTFYQLDSDTKRYSIPLSNIFSCKLHQISKITGIKTNALISLIIGNYLIDNYLYFDDGTYCDSNNILHHGLW